MRFERAKKQGSPYRLTDACVHRAGCPCDRGEERDPRSDGRETTIWKELDKDARLEERTFGLLPGASLAVRAQNRLSPRKTVEIDSYPFNNECYE